MEAAKIGPDLRLLYAKYLTLLVFQLLRLPRVFSVSKFFSSIERSNAVYTSHAKGFTGSGKMSV